MADQRIHKSFDTETKALEDTRSLIVTISTPTPDRSGDVVEPKGAILENFRKNPVVLFGHDYSQPPVARADELSITESGINAKVNFPAEGVSTFADTIYGLYKAGIMRAWSIGFIPKQMEPMADGGMRFTQWEMYEFSAVPVPANPEALTIARSFGADDMVIAKTFEPANEKHIEPALRVVKMDLAEDYKSYTLTFWDGKTEKHESAETLVPLAKESPELLKALSGMRDSLKESDKSLGLALRSMKTLLEPLREGVK